MNDNIKPSASSSAAGLESPDFPTFFSATVSTDESEAQLDRLRAMKRSFEAKGYNRNDCVRTLVRCCLDDGTDTIGGIVSVLVRIGCNRQHVGALTRGCTGSDPTRHRWWRDATGRLIPHSDVM